MQQPACRCTSTWVWTLVSFWRHELRLMAVSMPTFFLPGSCCPALSGRKGCDCRHRTSCDTRSRWLSVSALLYVSQNLATLLLLEGAAAADGGQSATWT